MFVSSECWTLSWDVVFSSLGLFFMAVAAKVNTKQQWQGIQDEGKIVPPVAAKPHLMATRPSMVKKIVPKQTELGKQ